MPFTSLFQSTTSSPGDRSRAKTFDLKQGSRSALCILLFIAVVVLCLEFVKKMDEEHFHLILDKFLPNILYTMNVTEMNETSSYLKANNGT